MLQTTHNLRKGQFLSPKSRQYWYFVKINFYLFVLLKAMAGIYFHIPFCKKACAYCDFHFSTNLALKPALVSAMRQELEQRQNYLSQRDLDSVYFGGGSPSILTDSELQSLMNAVTTLFRLKNGAEITLEANPDDMSVERLAFWKQQGINRLSVGLQSFNDAELQWMNRAHSIEQTYTALQNAAMIGFTNISIDLIYGSKYQSENSWKDTVEKALSLKPKHISAYNLTIEEKTRLGTDVKKGKEPDVDEELSSKQFLYLSQRLAEAGFEHYEISNFALPNYRAVHNSNYWKQAPYLGIGPSAHSFDTKSRQWNIRNNQQYVRAIENNLPYFEREVLTVNDCYNEYVMTGFRTLEGCSVEEIEQRFGTEIKAHFQNMLNQNLHAFEIAEGRVRLTQNGRLQADGIASSFFIVGETF